MFFNFIVLNISCENLELKIIKTKKYILILRKVDNQGII